MVLGMSGPPGACAHPHVAAAIVIVPAHASSPRMAESLAVAPQSKQSSATLLFAQVSHEPVSVYLSVSIKKTYVILIK